MKLRGQYNEPKMSINSEKYFHNIWLAVCVCVFAIWYSQLIRYQINRTNITCMAMFRLQPDQWVAHLVEAQIWDIDEIYLRSKGGRYQWREADDKKRRMVSHQVQCAQYETQCFACD